MVRRLTFLLFLGLGAIGFTAGDAFGLNLDIRLTNGNDDAEEHLADGSMDVTSTDLEFPYEDAGTPSSTDAQLNMLRFTIPIPQGATITKAYVEFEVDETKDGSKPVNVIIEGQLVPNAPAFASTAKNLSSREPWTTAKVTWSVPNWTKTSDKFQTPDLAAVIQEIIDQEGWTSGNAFVLSLRDDPNNPSTGLRCAESVEGEATAAPLLHLEAFVGQATNPSPANGATGVLLPLVTWTAGDTAVAHNVYVGASPELTAADLVGPQLPVAAYFHAPGLEPGVTYYWRVDEIDAAGVVYTGNVWSFTAEPIVAWASQPANGAADLFPSQTLSWSPGTGAALHQVFLSSNPVDVANGAAAADKGKTTETKFVTGLLQSGTIYYWRVDESDAAGKVNRGAIWSFTTAAAVSNKIAFQWWDGISGGAITDLTGNVNYPNNPTGTELRDEFVGKFVNERDNYGSRMYGWLTPPESGDYTFSVAANDAGQLWLSTDADPNNAKLIATSPGVDPRQWDSNASQKSTPIPLQAGQKYFIQTLHKEGTGRDHIAAGWQGPGIAATTAISAQYVDAFALAPVAVNVTLDLRIAAGGDDAEEHLSDGTMDITSTDMEFPYEDKGNPSATDPQLNFLRFVSIPLPKGAQILKAYLEFEQDETKGNDKPVNVVVEGQLTPNAPAITSDKKNLSSRAPWSVANVKWTVPTAMTDNTKFQSPDLTAILQEIIDQDGWAIDNALALAIRDDPDNPSTGLRCTESVEGEKTAAPLLHLEVLMP